MTNRETIIETDGDGGAAVIVAGLCVAALVVVGAFFFINVNHDSGQSITVSVPKITVSAAPPGH